MNPVDKRRVRLAFSRAAAGYDGHDRVQARVRARVLAALPAPGPAGRRVLDVGAGTGALLAALAGTGARLAAVDLAPAMCLATRSRVPAVAVAVADAEALPFAAGAFDLVLSTSALQWLPRLDLAASEIARVLAPGGVASLALFGERTLHELRDAWAAGGGERGTHRFASAGELAATLAQAGLRVERLEEEEVVERHADARSLLRALKAVGAQGAAPGPGGLAGARATREMLGRYDARRDRGGVPATYHVLHAVARRA